MFNKIRRMWQDYLRSIPQPDEPEPVSDREIVDDHFKAPPVPREQREAFEALSALLLAHLPDALSLPKGKQLRARLKPGVEPAEALGGWINDNNGPKSRVGVMALDWKAREEVQWQAASLARAHGVALDWAYDVSRDTEWEDWQARHEAPVDTPLRHLAKALLPHGLALCRFSVDDAVYAFAVRVEQRPQVQQYSAVLGIEVA
ncbi:MAG: hypothetical protein K9J82_00015 [Methylotenera sp.]|nr:hypothetical protein [Methylotenera sp.]